MSVDGSRSSVHEVYQRVGALLALRRPDEALAHVRELAQAAPDSFDVPYLSGLCHVVAWRVDAAEEEWRRATSRNPDHALCVVLGVRCALIAGPKSFETAWVRAQRLPTLAPDSAAERFWVAYTAALTGRTAEANAEVAVVTRLDPAGSWPLYTAAEVDLALSARRRRRAVTAEAAVRELLGRDPQDPRALELQGRTLPLQRRWWWWRGRLAENRLRHSREAARAGVLPQPGELERLTSEAARPAALVVMWVVVTFFGGALLDVLGLALAILVVSVVAGFLIVSSWHRLDRVLRALPVVSRRRFVRPITKVAYTASAVLAAVGVGGLLILHPFTPAHAVDMELGKDRNSTVERPLPVFTFPEAPTFPTFSPGVAGIPSSGYRVTLPGAVTSTTDHAAPTLSPVPSGPPSASMPPAGLLAADRATARVAASPGTIGPQAVDDDAPDGVDPEEAWTLMRYWVFVAGGSIVVAGSLSVRAFTLRRAFRSAS